MSYARLLPSKHQEHFLNNWKNRNILVWARRAGKDLICLLFLVERALKKKGVYFYIFPEREQGLRAIFEGMTHEGVGYLDYLPKHLCTPRKSDLSFRFVNGSVAYIMGSEKDHGRRLKGVNLLGAIFSEFAEMDGARIWGGLQPTLAVTGGWAIFNGVVNGKNHYYDLYQKAQKDPELWYASYVKADQYLGAKTLENARRSGISAASFSREYMLDWDTPVEKSIFGEYLEKIDWVGASIEEVRAHEIFVSLDLGVNDNTAMFWFHQVHDSGLTSKRLVYRIVDFYMASGKDPWHYSKVLNSKGYTYGALFLPHDARARHGRCDTYEDFFIEKDFPVFVMSKVARVEDGIDAVRLMLQQVHFQWRDCNAVREGLYYLRRYGRNPRTGVPDHDKEGASNVGDAFRYMSDAILASHEGLGVDSYHERMAQELADSGLNLSY